jgi:hypothetical protein
MCNYPEFTIVRTEKDRRNILEELLEKTQIITKYRTFLYPEENQKTNTKHMNNTHPTVWQGILNTKQNKINSESKHRW